MPKLNKLNPELEKLENYLEKYVKAMKDEVSRCDETLKLKETNKKQQSELQHQKKELETKIEKAQLYLDKIRVPENRNFIELGQPKKYWGSTVGLDKPLCERYTFEHNGESITLDITHELSKKLKLKPKGNFYVAKEALEKEKIKGAITIENETEI